MKLLINIIAIIVVVVILVSGIILISYWNTPISKAESRTMQAIALQEDGSAEPCTVLISGISYHYLFRNHADSFEATEPGGVFVNGSRIMDSLILPSDIDSDWMFWQDDMLWCDAAGEQLIVLLHRDADIGGVSGGAGQVLIQGAHGPLRADALPEGGVGHQHPGQRTAGDHRVQSCLLAAVHRVQRDGQLDRRVGVARCRCRQHQHRHGNAYRQQKCKDSLFHGKSSL